MSKSMLSRVLIIEDDPAISAVIKYHLNKEGYNAVVSKDGNRIIDLIAEQNPDLIVLDWMLPGLSGIDIISTIRQDHQYQNIPIIMISSRSEDLDKITGLSRGADDYMVKPFTPVELIARIHAIFRRIRPAFAGQKFSFDDIEMDLNSCEVRRSGKLLKLAPIEFQILQVLMETPGKVYSRQQLITKIWGPDIHVGMRTVDVHITRLRRILMSHSRNPDVDVIKTVRLMGYALKLGEEE